jgi:Flp pilus assembly protein TadG
VAGVLLPEFFWFYAHSARMSGMSNMRGNGAEYGIKRVSRLAKTFARAEDGAMIIFGLFIFLIMLMAGGMAVDMMRGEYDRAHMQYTSDNAALAAGSMSNPLSPEDVVADYFAKSGIKNYSLTVSGNTTDTSRSVNVQAQRTMNTFFVNMLGIDEMTLSASSGAIEASQKVEISLVLDVSGSMGRNGKLENLKTAAKEFVDTLLTADSRDLVSISIVPYNMQVNAGADILDRMQVTDEHAYSNCVDFKDNQFGSTSLDLNATTYQRTGHFDPFYRDSTDHANTSYDDNLNRYFMCPTTAHSEIMLFSQDIDDLKAKIDSLQAGGNTSIDVGVRWGSAFLDPSTQPLVASMPNVPTVFADRPLPYTEPDVLKVLVVMTDGKNTTQYALDDQYKEGPSNVWYDPDSTWMGIRMDEGTGVDADGSGHKDDAVFFNSDLYTFDLNGDGIEDKYFSADPHNAANAVRLSWPEVWNLMSTRYNAYYNHYAQAGFTGNGYDEWRDKVVEQINSTTKNARLQTACSAAKAKNMAVYTIGFEVTTASGQVMKDCANSPANYFGVEGTEISNAFNQIAGMIQRLKLVN